MTNILQTTITPRALTLAQEIDFWYMVHNALETLCEKLDADTAVPLDTYEANCWTAIINTVMDNSQGNRVGLRSSELNFHSISPRGITGAARWHMMYNLFNAFETLCEQLDTDVLTDSNYEALCYTAILDHIVRDPRGQTDLGNGQNFYWGPTAESRKYLVELMYKIFDAIETLTEKLDADGTVTDTNYEALCYTAICTMKVENGAGNTVGN